MQEEIFVSIFCKQKHKSLNPFNVWILLTQLCRRLIHCCFCSDSQRVYILKLLLSYKRKTHLPCELRAKAWLHLCSWVFGTFFFLIWQKYAKSICLTLKTREHIRSNFAWKMHILLRESSVVYHLKYRTLLFTNNL